jgi:hypothetical protein
VSFRVLRLLFPTSGAVGLGHQVLWSRFLLGFIGVSACCYATVLAAPMGGLALGPAAPGPGEGSPSADIQVEPLDADSRFPDAVAPGSLRRVCAETEDALRGHFEEQGAPFDPELVASSGGRHCHIDYAPTVPGFRADPEDRRIRELFVNVDGLSFLARRAEVFGDSLDVSKALLGRLPPGVGITLGTQQQVAAHWFEEALSFHYGERRDRVRWRQSRVAGPYTPWVQDYLKSGRAGVVPKILVTRNLFEGRRDEAAHFTPMLDSLQEERFARSKLSWEGGDLLFVRHPRDPDRLVLVFGDSAKAYWGRGLSQEEYAYVLRREFGADLSVDLSGLVYHIDYLVAFLPADRIALIARPLAGHRELAEAAAAVLEERFGGEPPATLRELRRMLGQPDALSAGRRRVEELLSRAKEEAARGWPRHADPALAARMAHHLATHCPESPDACFQDPAIEVLLGSDPTLLRDWVGAAVRDRTESVMDRRLLAVVESQLSLETLTQARIEAKARELEGLGFRVVRVPRFADGPELEVAWSGISYVNSLLVDRRLFVPQFGFGPPEQAIFEELDRALPPDYEVVPVYARHMLLYNGGVHCSVAIVRE